MLARFTGEIYQMKKTLKLIRKFEKRNNKAIVIKFIGDGSGEIRGFWKDEKLAEFESTKDLHELLKTKKLKHDNRKT
jgi:hypothetical protein